ncbi:serine/threonine-protein kinase SBK1 isoform X1 [Ixodes scapularis]
MSVTDGVRRPSRQFPMDKSRQQATIHRVRELQLAAVQVEDHYDVLREIGSGDYGKVVLARHRETGSQVALKAVPRATTTLRDFLIEFHYSYFLSPHMSILDTYDVCFETPEHYYFAQEVRARLVRKLF